MRSPRLKVAQGVGIYHCISRVVGGQFLIEEVEKEHLRKLLGLIADFCGVDVITYALLSNHFHLLIRLPAPAPVSDAELLRRVRLLYPETSSYVQVITQDLRERGQISGELRERLLRRMGDLSMYLKELKQRYTRWFNRRHNRYGTLWAERFKSLVVEAEIGRAHV